MASTALDQLKQYSVVVADTGDFETMKQYKPRDATTNPTLILQACAQPQYEPLINEAIQSALASSPRLTTESSDAEINEAVSLTMDELLVTFGSKILEILPSNGRVSSEVAARLSFDTRAEIDRAQRIIGLYAKRGIAKERILIKLATTWEGCQAAKVLEHEHGIHCNMTLLFSLAQAAAAGDVGAKLISPFVGRIYDWHVAHGAKKEYPVTLKDGEADPGVQSVARIYKLYKFGPKWGRPAVATEIMAASFRNTREIVALAGCDLLTVSPSLLSELNSSHETLTPLLGERMLQEDSSPPATWLGPGALSEAEYRWWLNADEMANDKLADGIRRFDADSRKLEAQLRPRILAALRARPE